MAHPTLRHPRLCRILTYVVVLGGFLLPMIVALSLPFVPEGVKALAVFGSLIALVVYLFREFVTLMTIDWMLAMLSCYRTARTQYPLPPRWTLARMERRLARFGTRCAPTALQPQPADLRYRLSPSWTVYSRGIERVVAAYHIDTLDGAAYRAILSSGRANSKALIGRKSPRFLDKQQKKAPLHRVTVIFIFARRVDPQLAEGLYDLVCKQCGDAFQDVMLPCVVDLSRKVCVFNSLRVPYVGFGYAVKNRGIRQIRRLVFGGRLPLEKDHFLPPQTDAVSLDLSLWEFWKTTRMESGQGERKLGKKLKTMADREISLEGDRLYLKWGEQGLALSAKRDPETRTVAVEEPRLWAYPKPRPIAKKTIQSIQEDIERHFSGWSVVFGDGAEGR